MEVSRICLMSTDQLFLQEKTLIHTSAVTMQIVVVQELVKSTKLQGHRWIQMDQAVEMSTNVMIRLLEIYRHRLYSNSSISSQMKKHILHEMKLELLKPKYVIN